MKVKMTQWQSFGKCCTRASSDSSTYVRDTGRSGAALAAWVSRGLRAFLPVTVMVTLALFQNSEGIAPAQQQVALLDLQSALFCSQLEIQKLQRLVRQKERQLADCKRCVQLVEAAAQEREQQKEAAWKHNQVTH